MVMNNSLDLLSIDWDIAPSAGWCFQIRVLHFGANSPRSLFHILIDRNKDGFIFEIDLFWIRAFRIWNRSL